MERHLGERKVLTASEEDALSLADSEMNKEEVELEILDESDGERFGVVKKFYRGESYDSHLNFGVLNQFID